MKTGEVSASGLLASVDVFDTVLTRAVGRPEALFLILGRTDAARSHASASPEYFARARVQAEQRARARHGACTGLLHIAEELAVTLDLTDEQTDALVAAEMATEARLLRPVPGAAAWLHGLRRIGGKVAFVSDTYLPSVFVRQQLIDKGLWAEGDSLYVSCDASVEKWSGRLFATVARCEGRVPWRILHHGNDPVADGGSARRAGLRVRPVTVANLNRYEKILEEQSFETGGMSSVFAGASRLARLDVGAAAPERAAIADVAAGVAAPVLVAFVLSVLRHAARGGIRRLYFVARDGELLLRIARTLAAPAGFKGGLKYLYGSRRSWNLPAVDRVDERQLDWIFDYSWSLSIRSLLERVAMSPEEIAGCLVADGFPPEMWSDNLSAADRARLRRVVADGEVANRVVTRAAERRGAVLGYLDQSGLTDGVPSGVVDLGWFGRSGAALCHLLHHMGAKTPECFYYVGLHAQPPAELRSRTRPYLFHGGAGTGPDFSRMPGLFNLLETFCAGSHGLVLGFDDTGPEVLPVLRPGGGTGANAWQLRLLRETVDRFLANLDMDAMPDHLDADLRPAVTTLLEAFVGSPTRAEAEAWGTIRFSEDQNEAFPRPLAAAYGVRGLLLGIFCGFTGTPVERHWPAASRKLSSRPVAAVMGRPYELALKGKRRVRRVVARGHRHGDYQAPKTWTR